MTADGTALDLPVRKSRIALDYYPTPSHLVRDIRPHLPRVSRVFDPACGIGELLDAIGAGHGEGIELDASRAATANRSNFCDVCVHGDALQLQWPDADLLIMNPPFEHAQKFIEKALDWRAQDPTRFVACLARLTILESKSRREMHLRSPADVYVFATRPRFRGDTEGTDSVTACWLLWGPGRGGRWSVL